MKKNEKKKWYDDVHFALFCRQRICDDDGEIPEKIRRINNDRIGRPDRRIHLTKSWTEIFLPVELHRKSILQINQSTSRHQNQTIIHTHTHKKTVKYSSPSSNKKSIFLQVEIISTWYLMEIWLSDDYYWLNNFNYIIINKKTKKKLLTFLIAT